MCFDHWYSGSCFVMDSVASLSLYRMGIIGVMARGGEPLRISLILTVLMGTGLMGWAIRIRDIGILDSGGGATCRA